MSTCKMLCLDIDGTLLNSKHELSEPTAAAIRKAHTDKGILIILASARMPQGIHFLQDRLGLDTPMVCYNGALVQDKPQEHLLSHRMAVADMVAIYALARQSGIHMSVYRDDEWYSETMDAWTCQEQAITGIRPAVCEYQGLFDRWGESGAGGHKILCMGDSEDIAQFQAVLTRQFANRLTVSLSKSTYLEIIPLPASKRAAVAFLLSRYCLRPDQLVAIGDHDNDVEMLRFAGLGIAMGNASERVKRQADRITLSNDDDGVVHALQEWIL